MILSQLPPSLLAQKSNRTFKNKQTCFEDGGLAFKGIKLIDGQVLTIMQPVTMAEGRDWLVITFYFVTYCKINEHSMDTFE